MKFISGELGSTITFWRRDFYWMEGLDWPDGRDGTLYMNLYKNKSKGELEKTQGIYGVGEVKEPGYKGRIFIFDKIFPKYVDNTLDRLPPYTVRLNRNGETSCNCMAASCKHPTCRHVDALLSIINQGGLENE